MDEAMGMVMVVMVMVTMVVILVIEGITVVDMLVMDGGADDCVLHGDMMVFVLMLAW
jgi:hypothetical protein